MDIQKKELTRRDFIRVASAGAAGTSLAALHGHQSLAATSASGIGTGETIKRGGTLRVVVQTDFQSMWPMMSENASPWDCFDPLFKWRQDEKGKWVPMPALVESWELGPSKAILKIRQGVKFHDGSSLDAEVVHWNIEQMRNNPRSSLQRHLAPIDPKNGAQALDKYTLQINLTAPFASLPVMLSDFEYPARIVSKAAFEKLGEDGLSRQAVGTGPFRLVKWESGTGLTVKRFEDYWEKGADGKPLPYVDEVVYRFIPQDSVRMVEMRTGNADFSDFIPAKDVPALRNDPSLVYQQNEFVASIYYFFFNAQKPPFNENLKLRQAVQHAIDREAIAKVVGLGLGKPVKYHFTAGTVGYDESVPYYWYNPERARQLLKEAGYPGGLDVTLSIVARDIEQQQAEMMKQMLDAVGIRTTIDAMEQLAWSTKVLKARNFQFATRRNLSQPDPDRVLTMDWTASSLAGAEIPEVTQLASEGRASFDPQRRHQVYVRAQKIMYDSSWWGYLWMMPRNYLLNKRVRNFPRDIWATFMRERELWLAS